MAGTILFLDTIMRSFALIRHSFFLIPLAYITIANGLLKIKSKTFISLIIGIILLFNVITLAIYYTETTKTPWEEAVLIIEEKTSSPIILFDRTGTNVDLYRYYQKEDAKLIGLTYTKNNKLVELASEQVFNQLEPNSEFWFISSRNFKGKIDYKKELEKEYQKLEEFSLKEMTMVRFSVS